MKYSIKEGEKAIFPPQISRPDYGRRFYFCPSCNTGYYNADKCPSCGTKTREKGRKRENKPWVNLDLEDGEGGS